MITALMFQPPMLCMITNLKYLENHIMIGLLNGGSGHIQSLLTKIRHMMTMESIATLTNTARSGFLLELLIIQQIDPVLYLTM